MSMEERDLYQAKPSHHGPSLWLVVFLSIAFGVVAGFGGTLLALWAGQQKLITLAPRGDSEQATTAPNPIDTFRGPDSLPRFAPVANNLNESVVNINTLAKQQNPFSFFFGGGEPEQVVTGLGTGIIVDTQGHILTNYHVVKGANEIRVTVMHASGKKEYTAKLIGGDESEDLAVIKIDGKGLKPIRFGNSDALRPGEWVMAIGNPFGFEHTVSVGVVSALNRDLRMDVSTTMSGLIQTDASINPGNSGGPLVNLNGEVVGINSAIYVGRGGNQPQANGIGFAIPSNHAKEIMETLRSGKKVQHPYIGVRYEMVTDQMRRSERLPMKHGALIRDVDKDGPAAKDGLLPGDVIISMSGKALREDNDLSALIKKLKVGDTVTAEVQRWEPDQGKWVKKSLRIKTGEKPADIERNVGGGLEQPQPQEQPQERTFPFPIPW